MPLNTGLFSKIKGKNIALLILIWFAIENCRFQDSPKIHVNTKFPVEKLLQKGDSLSGISLSQSYQTAQKALKLAKQSNDTRNIVNSFLLLGKIQTLNGQNDSAFTIFNYALETAKQNDYLRGICRANLEIGDVYYTWGNYEKAFAFFNTAQQIARENHFSDCLAEIYNCTGKYYHIKNDFVKTLQYYNQALSINRKLDNKKQIALTLVRLGKYHIGTGNLSEALDCYLEAYRISDQINDGITFAEICNHLGGLYQLIDQPGKALEYHKKALSFRNSVNTPEGIAKSFNNIGKIYLDINQPDSAFSYLNRSLALCKQSGYLKGTVKALTNLGKVFIMQGKTEDEKQSFQAAFQLAEKSGYSAGMAESATGLGNYFLLVGDYDKAIEYYAQSLKTIDKTNFNDVLQSDYSGLYQCFLKKGNTAEALKYHLLQTEVDKKLLNKENSRQLAILSITFDSERKEKDNEVLRKDIELKQLTIRRKTDFIWLTIAALFSSILFCFLLFFRFENKKKANKTLEKLNAQITQQNSELEKLNVELEKSNREKDMILSIIAHELRNPLYWFQNVAEMLSLKYQTMSSGMVQKTLTALDESAKNAYHLMDNLLHWSRSRLNRINPVISEHLLELLVNDSIRMYKTILRQKNIQLSVLIDKNRIVKADADLFMFVVRNLLSNAIKFTPENGLIQIKSEQKGDMCIISISDSGIGIDPGMKAGIFNSETFNSSPGLMNEKGSGFGLKLCKEFVKMNHGEIWLDENRGNGTCFCFSVPVC